jgi:hypothetical protein
MIVFYNLFCDLKYGMEDAAAECCKFGMRLASLETAAEYLCVISNELGEFCKTIIVFKSKILSCGAL